MPCKPRHRRGRQIGYGKVCEAPEEGSEEGAKGADESFENLKGTTSGRPLTALCQTTSRCSKKWRRFFPRLPATLCFTNCIKRVTFEDDTASAL